MKEFDRLLLKTLKIDEEQFHYMNYLKNRLQIYKG